MSFAAVLLCGGRSTRMGCDKAFIDWQGRPLWQVQLDKLQQLGPERLLISCRAEQKVGQVFNLSSIASECVFDPPEADDGPLGAITRCLELVQMPLLVLAVDMPWMTVEFLRDHILPGGFFRGPHGFETLCAVYRPDMLPAMQGALRERRLALQRVVEESHPVIHEITTDQSPWFQNANTPAELAR
ncbi:MAG: molybdenum cofactor guanylyltransferase [Verrucomicrobiaceae bacterium]|jgi:molybdopterin-guanine dinucleotide biosynthesis protein A|nr:molybdenum cofactor guanylyltransferase [Verrucomicrobiaceae bacterium]